MKPAATIHTVATRHDRRLAESYVAFRNAIWWPTRKLQRLLGAAVIVAVGFLFQPGPARYACWAVAGAVLVWVLISNWVAVRTRLASDPVRKGSGVATYEFSGKGFRAVGAEDAEPAPWLSYEAVRALHTDRWCWILSLTTGEAVLLARDGVDGGTTSPSRFEAFLTAKTKLGVEPVHTSASATIKRVEAGRRGYLDAHPNKIAQLLNARSEKRSKRDTDA